MKISWDKIDWLGALIGAVLLAVTLIFFGMAFLYLPWGPLSNSIPLENTLIVLWYGFILIWILRSPPFCTKW